MKRRKRVVGFVIYLSFPMNEEYYVVEDYEVCEMKIYNSQEIRTRILTDFSNEASNLISSPTNFLTIINTLLMHKCGISV